MATDNERREVARRIRETGEELGSAALLWYHIAKALGVRTATDGKTSCGMLADLIEPSFDLDTVQRVCFECMEGCDEPEWTLYTTVYDAIARYKRGESGPTCDLDKLLALADEIEKDVRTVEHYDLKLQPIAVAGYARRIREALGVKHGD